MVVGSCCSCRCGPWVTTSAFQADEPGSSPGIGTIAGQSALKARHLRPGRSLRHDAVADRLGGGLQIHSGGFDSCQRLWAVAKWLRHHSDTVTCVGSNPTGPTLSTERVPYSPGAAVVQRRIQADGTSLTECTVSVNRPGLGPGNSRFDSCHSDVVSLVVLGASCEVLLGSRWWPA